MAFLLALDELLNCPWPCDFKFDNDYMHNMQEVNDVM